MERLALSPARPVAAELGLPRRGSDRQPGYCSSQCLTQTGKMRIQLDISVDDIDETMTAAINLGGQHDRCWDRNRSTTDPGAPDRLRRTARATPLDGGHPIENTRAIHGSGRPRLLQAARPRAARSASPSRVGPPTGRTWSPRNESLLGQPTILFELISDALSAQPLLDLRLIEDRPGMSLAPPGTEQVGQNCGSLAVPALLI